MQAKFMQIATGSPAKTRTFRISTHSKTDLEQPLEQVEVMDTSVIISDFQSHLSSENAYSASLLFF